MTTSGLISSSPSPGTRGSQRDSYIHLTRTSYADAVRSGRLVLDGPRSLARAFPTWIRPSPFAAATPGTAAAADSRGTAPHRRER